MDSSLEKLPASALRTIIIRETRKFVLALQYGSTLSDLQEIRDHIKKLEELLSAKEKEETQMLNMDDLPLLNIRSIKDFR
jgi:hypothetical protein